MKKDKIAENSEGASCIFCKIIKKEIPAEVVYEDKYHLAFMDLHPINSGHILLIPKEHEDYIFDLKNKNYSKLFLKAKELSLKLKKAVNSKRIGLAIEGFGVPHAHIHLVPVNNPNELNPERAKPSDTEELKKIAEKIRDELK